MLAAALASLLVFPAGAPASPAQATAPKPKIVILEGEGAINNVRQRTARETIVQVQDENDRPVAGAVVIFTLPDRGASGVFANNAQSVTLTTDAQGRAATSFTPNNVAGDVQIRVDASYQGQRANTVINQSSVLGAAAARGSGKVIAIVGIVAAAAAGGILAATRRGSSQTPTTPTTPPPPPAVTVTAGTPSVGPPP